MTIPLFLPDDLSGPGAAPRETPEPTRGSVLSALASVYGIADPGRVASFGGLGTVSENFLVQVGEARRVLKRRPWAEPGRLEAELRLAEHARDRGVPVAPVIPALGGELVGRHGGDDWALFEFVEGGHFGGTAEEIEAAADVFARLIMPQARGPLPTEPPPSVPPDRLLDAAGESDAELGDLSRTFRPAIEAARRDVSENMGPHAAERAIVHTDYHPRNLIFREGRVACVLDFEDVKPYPPVAALGFAAYKLLREAVSAGALDLAGARRLVSAWADAYEAGGWGGVARRTLGTGARLRVLDLIELILRSCLIDRDDRLLPDLQKQIRSLSEIDELFGPAG
jgi:Ser/Thr protein kinase RdoA (MazF antagonist)